MPILMCVPPVACSIAPACTPPAGVPAIICANIRQ
jgi:hypothetical protein